MFNGCLLECSALIQSGSLAGALTKQAVLKIILKCPCLLETFKVVKLQSEIMR